jgi:hypothetical protein
MSIANASKWFIATVVTWDNPVMYGVQLAIYGCAPYITGLSHVTTVAMNHLLAFAIDILKNQQPQKNSFRKARTTPRAAAADLFTILSQNNYIIKIT